MSLTTRETALRLPAHIHALVQRAGREKVLYSTARRPSGVPEPGGGVDALHNAVVGSPIEATQGTPSEQPQWQGNTWRYGGDDFLEAAIDAPYAPAVYGGVYEPISPGDGSSPVVIGAEDASQDAFFGIAPDQGDPGTFRVDAFDLSGNGGFNFTALGMGGVYLRIAWAVSLDYDGSELSSAVAFVAKMESNGSVQKSRTSTVQLGGSIGADVLTVGRGVVRDQPDGGVPMVVAALGCSCDPVDLVESIAQHWRIV